MNETKEIAPKKLRIAPVTSLNLYSQDKPASAYTQPAEAVLAGGKKYKIKDLDEIADQNTQLARWQPVKVTNIEVGVQEDTNIVVPSFGVTSALFTRHFKTLRLLRRRVDLLKQSYYHQMDSDKCF